MAEKGSSESGRNRGKPADMRYKAERRWVRNAQRRHERHLKALEKKRRRVREQQRRRARK